MIREERIDLYRQSFAASRYDRLDIQQCLVRSAIDSSLRLKVKNLEEQITVTSPLNKYDYKVKFLTTVN